MKPLRCIFGFHRWEVISSSPCRGNAISTLTGDMRRGIQLLGTIEKCSRCGEYRGRLTDGHSHTTIDPDFLIATSEGTLHK